MLIRLKNNVHTPTPTSGHDEFTAKKPIRATAIATPATARGSLRR
jgi:hypothetical protein